MIIDAEIVKEIAFQLELRRCDQLGSIADHFVHVGSVIVYRSLIKVKSGGGIITVFEHGTVEVHICQQGISSLLGKTSIAGAILAETRQIGDQRCYICDQTVDVG